MPPSEKILGFSLQQLGYIRLIPCKNESLQFEFRRCVFPVDEPIRLRTEDRTYVRVPPGEHIVLSTSNDEVFAILEHTGILRGIYTTNNSHSRMKMNIITGALQTMTPDESRFCPLGKKFPIFPKNFIKSSANYDSMQSIYNPHIEPEETPVQARSRSLPDMDPPDRVLGIEMEQLGYLRLIPCTNHNQRFEFRKYVFPATKRIRIKINNLSYLVQPNKEYLVLSTSGSNIFAIMESSDTLRGIYLTEHNLPRIKLNMMSGEVQKLTQDEMRDCPVGKNNPISAECFIRAFANYDSLRAEQEHNEQLNSGSPGSSRQHSPELRMPEELPLHPRSCSPPGRPPSREVLGYSLDKLGYIRLIPYVNQNQRFEFRRYFIPVNKPIRLRIGNSYVPVPNREHIVLSTSNGDVYAILEYTEILRGLYATRTGSRLKINMISGSLEKMTTEEQRECHIGPRYPIFPRWFKKEVSDEDSLQHVHH